MFSFLKRLLGASGIALTLGLGFGAAPAQAAISTLPTCTPGVNCLAFGDFNVYSLPLLDLQAGGDGVPNPGDDFYFSSTYGQIQNYTIAGINNGQCTDTGNPPATADCSYNTPSANAAGTGVFSTKTGDAGAVADPGGAGQFTGDSADTWDIKTNTLLSLTGGTPLTAFFAFNETGAGTGLLDTALLIWAEVKLVNTTSGASTSFYLSNNIGGVGTNTTEANTGNLPVSGVDPNSAALNPWVYVHSGICTDAANNFTGFPDATNTCPNAGDTLRQQNNLGQNAAAFMVNSPALDTALNSGQYDTMQLLWKMAYLNGGGETLWIQSMRDQNVPEPGTLANMGLALLGLAFLTRRRRFFK